MILRRRKRSAATESRSTEILAELAQLVDPGSGRSPTAESERRALRLRHLAGIAQIREAGGLPSYPQPATAPAEAGVVPEIGPEELTPELLRGAILVSGCLLVRGAVERSRAEGLADSIDELFHERNAKVAGEATDGASYEEFQPEPGQGTLDERPWIAEGGGVLAVDSPPLIGEMLSAFERVGLSSAIRGYLGEPAIISAQKCTLRRADPAVGGAWHQDGNFMGDVRSLNVWLSLSRCGDVAPGLDLVPKRIEYLVPAGTDGMPLSYVIAPQKVAEAAGETPILRPVFEPGDALLFDHWFLHQTGSDPAMPNPRFAIESWFFGASGFPDGFTPLSA